MEKVAETPCKDRNGEAMTWDCLIVKRSGYQTDSIIVSNIHQEYTDKLSNLTDVLKPLHIIILCYNGQ